MFEIKIEGKSGRGKINEDSVEFEKMEDYVACYEDILKVIAKHIGPKER